jgi:hypothetical protein
MLYLRIYACSMKKSKVNPNQYGNLDRTGISVEATDGSPHGSTPPAVTPPPPYFPTVPSSRLVTRVLTRISTFARDKRFELADLRHKGLVGSKAVGRGYVASNVVFPTISGVSYFGLSIIMATEQFLSNWHNCVSVDSSETMGITAT